MAAEDFDQLRRDIAAHATGLGIAVFPATLDNVELFWPDDDWKAFLDVAIQAGARIVYLECTDHDTVLVGQATEAGDALTASARSALAQAQAWEGPTGVELGFVVHGVRHLWEKRAAWAVALEKALQASDDTLPGTGADGRPRLSLAEREAAEAAEAARLAPMVDRWVQELSEAPSVIAAVNQSGRHAAARALVPELGDWAAGHWRDPEGAARREAVWAVRRRLDDAVAAVKEHRLAEARTQLDLWAKALEGTEDFRAAASADMRRRAASAFVAERLGFPSADIRDRLLAALRK